jgi:predicted phage terminase large subunit-like protein
MSRRITTRERLTPFPSVVDVDTLDLIESLAIQEARVSFWAYRQYIRPDMLLGWWQREVAHHFQEFWHDYLAGKRPKLALVSPPQHGKSVQVEDFISWCLGKNPDINTIFASYGDELGVRTNLDLQRTMLSLRFRKIFPMTVLPTGHDRLDPTMRNTALLQFVGRKGSFRNTTVNGPVTGLGLDLGFIDDPIKGRAEANSPTTRNKTWDWFTDDFFSRFSKDAGFLVLCTRWHLDDPVGRMKEQFGDDMKVLVWPAIAEHDEKYRRKSEALFPEHKPLSFLLERKAVMSQASWQAEYQGMPILAGGGILPIEKIRIVETVAPRDIVDSVRYWDKAGTEDGGAYTCGMLMYKLRDGSYLIADVVRGQWSAMKREQFILQTAQLDERDRFAGVKPGLGANKPMVRIFVEQEPGSGGKESAENTVRMLAGHSAAADRVSGSSGSKEVRADPFAAQVQAGNVSILAADWNRALLEEFETWPSGRYKDQVDAAAGAFNKLTLEASAYDDSYSWV